tara:strand:+ start:3728 stop:3982 length:255 start_codon:yes stop_codon:yes gene_type:complete
MKFNKILVLFLLQFFLLTGIWAIDIGASGLVWDAVYGNSQAQGMGFIRSANQQYHLGLGLVYIVAFIELAWLLWLILKNGKTNN